MFERHFTQFLPLRNQLVGSLLVLPPALRLGYQHYYTQQYFSTLRAYMIVILLGFALFGAMDLYLLSGETHRETLMYILLVRYGLGCPLLLLYCVASFLSAFRQHHQLIIAGFIISLSATLWIMLWLISDITIQQVYFTGFLLGLLSGLIMSKIQFFPALICCALLGVFLLTVEHTLTTFSTEQLFIHFFFFLAVSAIGLLACLSNDIQARDLYFRLRNVINEQAQLQKDNSELYLLAQHDPLTGLPNRRYFDEAFTKEWRRAERSRSPLSICMIDVDNFKAYNDHYGHQEGDRCLIKIASLLKQISQRPGDFIARFGGEEFILILAETDLQSAATVARKICEAVEQLNITHEYSQAAEVVTVSIGVAHEQPLPGVVDRMALQSTLVRCADQALYEAKSSGKNCVEVYLPEEAVKQQYRSLSQQNSDYIERKDLPEPHRSGQAARQYKGSR